MTINQNSNKTNIKAWQDFLAQQGFKDVGTDDGVWGSHTTAATKEFQLSQKLDVDGVPGMATLGAAEKLGFVVPAPSFPPAGLLDVVFDISHLNDSVDFIKAKNSGMLAAFHKATQSTGKSLYHDFKYPDRRNEARKAGMLWGAYHFGTGGSGKDQATSFLDYAKPDGNTVLVLDFEHYNNNTIGETTMQVSEAVEFVEEVFKQTGKYPGIYSDSLLQEVSKDPLYKSLTQCWLWKAQYGSEVHLPPLWNNFSFWQYTDGKAGLSPAQVEGVGRCDRDFFNGTEAELFAFWKTHSV